MAQEEATREPDWPVCGRSGCIGVPVKGQEACLAHMDSEARKLALAALAPGADLDLRGVPINAELLQQVLDALRLGDDPPTAGDVRFDRAQFSGIAVFEGVRFAGEVWFEEAGFSEEARFDRAQFSERAVFRGVRFYGAAVFNGAQFVREAEFSGARFTGMAWFVEAKFAGMAAFTDAWSKERAAFSGAQFLGTAGFGRAQFSGIAGFEETRFGGEAWFGAAQFGEEARFEGTVFSGAAAFTGTQFGGVADFTGAQLSRARSLGPLFAEALILDRATFEQPVTIRVVSGMLSCVDTRFDDTATLRLRYAEAVLYRAVFTKPSTIVFAENAFEPRDELPEETFDEGAVARATRDRSPRPRLLSLHGTDVATLTLTELDLGACVFQGAYNLDKLRIVGTPPFADTPTGWKRGRLGGQGIPLWRWTRRQTLIEEHHWRASRPLPAAANGRPHPQLVGWSGVNLEPPGWVADRTGQQMQPLPPGRIALLYRALRKAQEDSKNEPGAADLYYGEMEMRRLAPQTPWGERVILALYWLVAGYGLRGLRALACLAAVVVGVAVLFELVGFAQHPSPPTVWGSLLFAARSTLSIADPEARLTAWGKLLQVSVRLAGPVLLGLALLSIRNRVKR
jgi:uncharacterized protein YjbI with pentapeptide repeats